MIKFAECYKKFKRGDHLNDLELDLLRSGLGPTVATLHDLGPRFDLAWRELSADFQKLTEIHGARAVIP